MLSLTYSQNDAIILAFVMYKQVVLERKYKVEIIGLKISRFNSIYLSIKHTLEMLKVGFKNYLMFILEIIFVIVSICIRT